MAPILFVYVVHYSHSSYHQFRYTAFDVYIMFEDLIGCLINSIDISSDLFLLPERMSLFHIQMGSL